MSQRPSRIKSFEGLKGFSVLMVILYHMFPNIFPGGFLMVNTFLVLGGYFFAYKMEQIEPNFTAIHWQKIGQYIVATFERLILPLVWMMMFVVLGLLLINPVELHYIRSDLFYSLFFVNNWYQIFTDQSYFVQMTNATPFTHLWYNAIYLQSFLVAIPLFLLTKQLKLTLPAKSIFWFVIVGLSHTLVLFLYDGTGDPSRVYYGLDTRFSSFALGMATAYSLPIILNYMQGVKNRKRIFTLFSIIVIGLTIFFVLTTRDQDPQAYLLVMPYFNIISMLLIWLITINSPVTRFFWGNPIFDFIGHRSYSYYLWYYPVIVFYMGQFRNLGGNMRLINLLIAITILVLGEILYRLVERPVIDIPFANHIRWRKDWQSLRHLFKEKKYFAQPVILSGIFVVCFAGFVYGLSQAKDNKRVALFELEYQTYRFAPNMLKEPYPAERGIIKVKEDYLNLQKNFGSKVDIKSKTGDPVKEMLNNYIKTKQNERLVTQLVNVEKDKIAAYLAELEAAKDELDELKTMHPVVAEELTDDELLFAIQVPMTLFGDSIVNINGINTMEVFQNGNYYGEGSLQIWDAIPIFEQMVSDGEVQENVVINLGTNASLDRPALDDMIELAGDRQVFFINTNSRVQHIEEVNNLIKEVAKAYPNVHEIDWYSYNQGHPDWYGEDEIHHSVEGMEHFTIIIAKTMYKDLKN